MRILVLNGSPKGAYSITLQTALYLQKRHPEHAFEVLNAGWRIAALEKDLSPVAEAVARAELVLLCYPVYTFIAPSQLHRLIELMKERGVPARGKYMTQITTSKHFFDMTAHRYVQENCQDMGMKCLRGLSADMDDLLTPKGRAEAEAFFRYTLAGMAGGWEEPAPEKPAYAPVTATAPGDGGPGDGGPGDGKPGDVVVLADLRPGDERLAAMVARFGAALPYRTRVVNLGNIPMRGGCLGCFHCATDGQCVYTDGFDAFLRDDIQRAQAVVYAFTIRDHSMGALFKRYDDRQFCNGHRTVTEGMPVAYLASGPYSAEANLQTILEGRAQVGGNALAGVATDERDPDGDVDRLADRLAYMLREKYAPPREFYGVGGMKIFRDLICQMRGMMKADHRYYKAHGQYDFPQRKPGVILKMYLVGALLRSPKLRAKLGNRVNEGMVAPYRKAIEGDKGAR